MRNGTNLEQHMHNFDQFDEAFKDKLGNHQMMPPTDLWENIESELPAPKKAFQKWEFWGGNLIGLSSLILLLFFFANYSIQINPKQEKNQVVEPISQNANSELNPLRNRQIDIGIKENLREFLAVNTLEIPNSTIENIVANTNNEPLEKEEKKEKTQLVEHSINDNQPTNLQETSTIKSTINEEDKKLVLSWLDFLQDLMDYRKNHYSLFKHTKLTPPLLAIVNDVAEDVAVDSGIKTAYSNQTQEPIQDLVQTNINRNINLRNTNNLPKSLKPVQPVLINGGKNNVSAKSNGWFAGSFYQYQGSFAVSRPGDVDLNTEQMDIETPVDDLAIDNVANATNTSNTNTTNADGPIFGNAYGLAVGYNFNKRFGIQTEWVDVTQADEYQYTIEDDQQQFVQVKYRYMQIPVLLKYRYQLNKNVRRPMMLNHLLGVQYGYLKSSDLTINELEEPVIKDGAIDRNNWGLVVGMDYDMYLSPKTSLSLGARSTFSKNFNSLTEFINFNAPSFDVLVGVNASFRYSFGSTK